MFVKIFTSILDGSLATDHQTRQVFEDMLKLCDVDGVVDMTPEAISGRTGVPLEIVTKGISKLEQPDPKSRTPDEGGRRIVRIDEHRDWGWLIVNYSKYRAIESAEQRRAKTRARVARFKERMKGEPVTPSDGSVTPGNALVTLSNAGNGMQRQKQKEEAEASTHVPPTRAREGELGLAAPENDVNRAPKAVPGSATALKPTWDMALKWMEMANEGGGDFKEPEVRQAFVTLGERGWTRTTIRGEQATQNWQMSLEKQIGYDRDRKENNAKHPQGHAGNNNREAQKPLSSRFICDNNNPAHSGPLITRKRPPVGPAAANPVATQVPPNGSA